MPSLNFYRPDALPDAQPTATMFIIPIIEIARNAKKVLIIFVRQSESGQRQSNNGSCKLQIIHTA